MHRFYVEPDVIQGGDFALPASEARHAVTVLRCRAGEMVEVLDGRGRRLSCEIVAVERRSVRVEVLREVIEPPAKIQINLYAAMTKGKAFDLTLEKATEIGVHQIVPVICERTVAVPAEGQSGAKMEKWRQTVIASIKQCGRAWLPTLLPPQSFAAAVGGVENCSEQLVAALDPPAVPLKERLRWIPQSADTGSSVGIWIGPEGDFSPSEYEVLRSRRFGFVSLTDSVLRSETAALFALACVHYELVG